MTSTPVHLTGPGEDTRRAYGPTLTALRGAVARSAELWRRIDNPDAPAPAPSSSSASNAGGGWSSSSSNSSSDDGGGMSGSSDGGGMSAGDQSQGPVGGSNGS